MFGGAESWIGVARRGALVVLVVLAACGSGEPDDPLARSGSPDPCGPVDLTLLEPFLDDEPETPRRSSEMSSDGAGLVLSCTISTEDGAQAVAYVQRLSLGRSAFEANRNGTHDAVVLGDDSYWVPSKLQLHVLDGDDLVALLLRGVEIDVPTAERLIDDVVERRRNGQRPAG